MRDMHILERVHGPQRAMKGIKGLEHLSNEDRLRAGTVQPREEKASEWRWEISSMYRNTQEEGAKKIVPCSSVMPSDRTRGNGHKLKHRRFPMNISEGDQALAQVAQGGCGVSILGDTQKLSE